MKTNFQLVSAMNIAFGNAQGDPANIDWGRVRKQSLNIADELGELYVALGAEPAAVKMAVANLKQMATSIVGEVNLEQVRDSLTDINVFSYGDHHLMGIDADRDMQSVIEGVMTRFVKNSADMSATSLMHRAKGVDKFYIEGEYPTCILKSAEDQPDAPKGKFLKSASYVEPVFYKATPDKPEPAANPPMINDTEKRFEKTSKPNVWRDQMTGRYHYTDENTHMATMPYDTPEAAEKALNDYHADPEAGDEVTKVDVGL